jgi:hypothetical protein
MNESRRKIADHQTSPNPVEKIKTHSNHHVEHKNPANSLSTLLLQQPN